MAFSPTIGMKDYMNSTAPFSIRSSTIPTLWSLRSVAHRIALLRNIYPRENKIVSWFAAGEGWHNYHHTFPWDYRTSEFGWTDTFNPSSAIIDFWASMGWAYDLKTASPKLVATRTNRTGDTRAYEGDKACCQTATWRWRGHVRTARFRTRMKGRYLANHVKGFLVTEIKSVEKEITGRFLSNHHQCNLIKRSRWNQ